MLEIELIDSVKKFVRAFHVVKLRHLKHFFRDWGAGTYEHTIKYLTGNHILHKHDNDCVSFAHPGKLPTALINYDATLRCLDAMTGILKSSEVRWFGNAEYPLNVKFVTENDEVYDMAYLDARNWVHKYTLLPIAWKAGLPPGQEDPFNHIAVIPNIELAQQLRDLPFAQFIVVDGNGGVEGIYDND